MHSPSIIVLFTSYRCNARCIMCGAWKKQYKHQELSPQDIKKIFSDTILSKSVKVVNLTGGEPTLRSELIGIIKSLVESCFNLGKIDISTNGIKSDEVIDKIEQALAFLLPHKVKLSVSVSIDGFGAVHDQVRNTPGAFLGVEKTITELKELMKLYPDFSVGLNFTINRKNYHDLQNVLDYGIRQGLGVNFTLSASSDIGVESTPIFKEICLPDENKVEVVSFIKELKQAGYLNSQYADFMLAWLTTGRRKGPCAFRKGMSILCEPDGNAYACGNFKQFKIGNILEKPFSKHSTPRLKFLLGYKNRCATCNSNCYIGSA